MNRADAAFHVVAKGVKTAAMRTTRSAAQPPLSSARATWGEGRRSRVPDSRQGAPTAPTASIESEESVRAWRKRLFWKLQALGWVGVMMLGIVFSTASYISLEVALFLTSFRVMLGVIFTCGMRYGFTRLRQRPGNPWVKAAAVFLVCGLISFADSGLAWLLFDVADIEQVEGVGYFLKSSILMRWMFYWLWSILYFGINYWLDTEHARLRIARAEAAARASELQVLRAQVNPHFLFNALNSILAEAENSASVRALTQALSEYLRFSLQQRGDIHPLGVELDALENYLRVEKARFEENLEYQIDAEPTARRTPVPVALVQPLLDNAIKYGQRSTIRPLRVIISAVLAHGSLQVTVANTGEWIVAPSPTGTGLANLCRRLQLLYGDAATLATEIASSEVRVRVHLPLEGGRAG